MVQVAMLVLAFPLGFFLADRRVAYGATAIVFAAVMAVQTPFVVSDSGLDAWYWIINAATLAVGLGLAIWGNTLGARRRARRIA